VIRRNIGGDVEEGKVGVRGDITRAGGTTSISMFLVVLWRRKTVFTKTPLAWARRGVQLQNGFATTRALHFGC
jgi:hypothetical protein